jgi:hypothetical protein
MDYVEQMNKIDSPVPLQEDKKNLEAQEKSPQNQENPLEIAGPKGPEPTRYGDWEQKGRCTDF